MNKCLTTIKSFILTYYQKNITNNFTEIPLHLSRIAASMKKKNEKLLSRIQKKGNPYILLVGM